MSVLHVKLRRDIAQSKTMLAAVVAIVAVGICCLVGFFGTSWNLDQAKDDYYRQTSMADFFVDLKKAPVLEARRLAQVPGVARIHERIVAPVVLDMEDVDRPISGKMISVPEEQNSGINSIVLRQGEYFGDPRRNEVLVEEAFAQARGLSPGDQLHLLINGERKTLVMAGTAISSENIYLLPPGGIVPEPADFGVFYVTRDLAAEAMGFQGACNSLLGQLTPEARRDPQPVLDEIARRLHPYGVYATTPLAMQPSNLSLTAELAGLATMATVMPLLFLSVSALVLNVLMTRLTTQQRTIVGALKALGYGNRTIMAHFLSLGLLVGLLGGLLGCLLGYLLAGGMTRMYTAFFTFPSLENHFYPGLMLTGLLVSLGFSLLGTLRGVRTITKLPPAEAMREQPPILGGAVFLERIPWLWRRLGFRWQLSLRNLSRNRFRSVSGIFAAAMGTALLVSTFGMIDSLKFMLTFQFDKVMLADHTLSFGQETDYGAVYELRTLPGVLLVEPVLDVPCEFANGHRRKKGAIQGIAPGAVLSRVFAPSGGVAPVPSSGLLLSKRLADQLGVAAGDSLTVTPTKGAQEPVVVHVAQIVETMFGLGVYADFHYLNALVGEEDSLTTLHVRTHMTPEQRRDFLRECKRYPRLQGLGERSVQRERMQTTFVDKLSGMAWPMVFFGAVIFLGSILNASLIGIMERKREIATCRVLGYSPLEVGNLMLRENMVINAVGILLGLPLGWQMLLGLATEYQNDMYAMPAVITIQSWIVSVLLAVGFVLLCQVVIQRAVNKLHWQEALNMKE